MTKKYMLISIYYRKLLPIKYFATFDEAYQGMISEIADAVETDPNHITEHPDYEEEFGIWDDSAWAYEHSEWYITKLEE